MKLNIPVIAAGLWLLLSCTSLPDQSPIDRFDLVCRHNILVDRFDSLASLTIGNGNFAFTTDLTGLQTFYKEYDNGVSLGTMSNWGWHTIPNSGGYDMAETYQYYDVEGRKVPYQHQPRSPERAAAAASYFRENPHRLHLGIIRLVIHKENGEEITIRDVQFPEHRLDLWRGEVSSRFSVEGQPVEVTVFAHQEKDMVSARIVSPLIQKGRLSVEWLFPYGIPAHVHAGYDFGSGEKHTSELIDTTVSSARILRQLDGDRYFVHLGWSDGASLKQAENHRFVLVPPADAASLEFSSLFAPAPSENLLPGFGETRKSSELGWAEFWSTGGAVDFSGSTDPRAFELERRVVLSQFLTKVNGSGNLPPQETGLTFNSWYGKFHLEMHWWHSAHFYNWQRTQYMESQLEYYRKILPRAREWAELQGYEGVRWPKMTGPDGINSPSPVGSYLIWQQPHLIYMAEQAYRTNPSRETLEKYADLVFLTAGFMADFPVFDPATGKYHLAPPLIPAQEHWNREITLDPPYELAYWHWALTVAQQWKLRLELPPDTLWEEVRKQLPAPVAIDGLYMGIANAPDSYTEPRNMRDHPMVLGTLGMLPLWDKVDEETMRNTLKLIMEKWDWPHTWGWDYPMVAMCATRLLEPEIALDALMKEVQKNTYLVNGHNYQDGRLRIYLPGNGGILKAVALMCAGWEGCTEKNPGFPGDGTWKVKWENLTPDF